MKKFVTSVAEIFRSYEQLKKKRFLQNLNGISLKKSVESVLFPCNLAGCIMPDNLLLCAKSRVGSVEAPMNHYL